MEEERSSAAGLLLVTLQDRVKGLNERLDTVEEEKAHLRLQLEASREDLGAADEQLRKLGDQGDYILRIHKELEVNPLPK